MSVSQAPGTEFLHVSIRLLDADFSAAIAGKYGLEDQRFERLSGNEDQRSATPVLNRAGRILGFFTWRPFLPAMQLIKETAPVAIAFCVFSALILLTLLRRLRITSSQLEVSESRSRYLAYHDPLARIPNRALFEDRMERALAAQRRSKTALALHAIDVD